MRALIWTPNWKRIAAEGLSKDWHCQFQQLLTGWSPKILRKIIIAPEFSCNLVFLAMALLSFNPFRAIRRQSRPNKIVKNRPGWGCKKGQHDLGCWQHSLRRLNSGNTASYPHTHWNAQHTLTLVVATPKGLGALRVWKIRHCLAQKELIYKTEQCP